MAGYLSPDVHLARVGDDLVVLDARTNAYFCLPRAGAAVRWNGRDVAFVDKGLEDAFLGAGFLTSLKECDAAKTAPPAAGDLGVAVASRVRAGDVALILAAWLTMFASYHGRPFGAVLQAARRQRRPASSRPPAPETVRLIAAFERVLPWLPFQGVCFYRAFLLRRILHWRGVSAAWVFGVQTWPFQAHCWLQIGDLALDDTADRLAAYTPILGI
ncbi:MAG: hypothetical protein BGN86_15535 [Caulobacterales bacterium 68-7]|nr:MAG: hypothetical protein BGN86_15535 [Caulobacterales bacterium 68-7]